MNITPEIKTRNLSFSNGKNFVSWKSGIKLDSRPAVTEINKTFLINEFIYSFHTKNKTICVANGIFGIVILLLDKTKVESSIRINSKNKLNRSCIHFDDKTKKLYIGVDNKITKIGLPTSKGITKFVIEKSLKVTLKKNEHINYIIKESFGDYKGFWLKTNSNGLYFIELKEAVGLSHLKKLWRIRTYTKRTNYDICKDEVCYDLITKRGILYVITNKSLYRFCVVATKLSLISSINFSSEVTDGHLFFIGEHIVVSGNNQYGSIIIRFNQHDFSDNTTFWCFSGEEHIKINHSVMFYDFIVLSSKNASGLIETQRVIFDNKHTPYFVIVYNMSSRLLEANELIISNFAEDDNHVFFVVSSVDGYAIKGFNKQTLELMFYVCLGYQKYTTVKLSFGNNSLYLITEKGMTVIHGREI